MKVWQIIVTDLQERFIGNLVLSGQPSLERLKSYLEYLCACDDDETESIIKEYEGQFDCCINEMGESILVSVSESWALLPDIPGRSE